MAENHKNNEEKPRKRRVKNGKRFTEKRKNRTRQSGNGRRLLFAVLLTVLFCFAVWRVWRSDAVQMRFVYLWPYQNQIVTYADRNHIDPFLVAAVIKNESGFKPGAVSQAGAVGMMQIMPETGEWIAGQMGLSSYRTGHLYDPELNIRMGCWYLSELHYEFRGNMVLQMLAYNAGRGNTHLWMNANGWDYEFGDIAHIPYEESRVYVASVLHDRDEYYRLYKDKAVSGRNSGGRHAR